MQEALICPYLIGPEAHDLAGTPLGQYQCTVLTKDDTWLLIRSINCKLEKPHDEQLLRVNYEAQWPSLEGCLNKIASTETIPVSKNEKRDEPDLSTEARTVLCEAAEDRSGKILMTKTLGGFSIQTNNKQLCVPNDPRVEAAFRAAVNDLISRRLLNSSTHQRKRF